MYVYCEGLMEILVYILQVARVLFCLYVTKKAIKVELPVVFI